MENRLIQIIPAPKGIFAITHDDCGERKEVHLICLGLTAQGEIQFYYWDDGTCRQTWDVVDRRPKR